MELAKAVEIVTDLKNRAWCGTDDLGTTIRISNEKKALETVLKYCVNTIALYEAWAKENGKHVCASCIRNSNHLGDHTRCPIEKEFALPKDGFCHLWEELRR